MAMSVTRRLKSRATIAKPAFAGYLHRASVAQ
jgi:hypothetical protein